MNPQESTATVEPQPGYLRRIVFVVLALSGLGAIVAAAVVGKMRSDAAIESTYPLPKIAKVPAFAMTDQDGKPVSTDDFLGTAWVADFIFTNCPGPCPQMSHRMLLLQNELNRRKVPGRLVSFSLDPERDTPDVLSKYASRFKADQSRWRFLTGNDQDSVWELAEKGFFQTAIPGDPDHQINHSTYFMIIDAEGYIRAAHQGLDPDQSAKELVARMAADLERLAGEP